MDEELRQIFSEEFVRDNDEDIKKAIWKLFLEEKVEERDVDDDGSIDDTEEKKRRQFRRDQELAEFEEKGGIGAVLKEILNPSDASMELDSVY